MLFQTAGGGRVMAKISLKEKAILTGVGIFILYALTVGFWFLKSGSRTAARNVLKKEEAKTRNEVDLISKSSYWEGEYQDEVARIPKLEPGEEAETKWWRRVTEIASSNDLKIQGKKTESGKFSENAEPAENMERIVFDVDWEGSMDTLVKFLYALRDSEKGLFDVQSLDFKPIAKKQGFLKGKMKIVCMYKTSEQ